MSPDFEYFFKMSVSSQYGHTLLGIVYFDIPVTIAVALLFHQVVKNNLIANLPVFFQIRFQNLLMLDFKQSLKTHLVPIIISAGIGALSHICWDAFTHNDGFFAQRISWYKHVVIPFDGVQYPLFYGLQQISTFTGFAIVLVYILFIRPQHKFRLSQPSALYWLLFLVIAGIVLFLRFGFTEEKHDVGNFVVSCITSILIALVICGFVNFRNRSTL